MAQVRETEFEYFVQDDFRVRKPDIRVDAPSQVRPVDMADDGVGRGQSNERVALVGIAGASGAAVRGERVAAQPVADVAQPGQVHFGRRRSGRAPKGAPRRVSFPFVA